MLLPAAPPSHHSPAAPTAANDGKFGAAFRSRNGAPINARHRQNDANAAISGENCVFVRSRTKNNLQCLGVFQPEPLPLNHLKAFPARQAKTAKPGSVPTKHASHSYIIGFSRKALSERCFHPLRQRGPTDRADSRFA
jgi:hypothetical protein